MKLTVEPIRLQLAHTFTIARGSSDYRDTVAVTLECDGISGHGAAAPNPRHGESQESVLHALSAIQLAGDIKAYTCFIAMISAPLKDHPSARAALEMAVMDWNGKAMKQPLYRLWGLDPTDMPPTSYTIGIDTPEKVKLKTREASSYQVLKVKLGGENDREMIEAIRDVSDQVIRVDANEGWHNRERALDEILWLAERNVEFVEQPMPADRFADMVWLKQRSPLPLMADEAFAGAADIPKLSEAYHGVNFKLMKGGGIQPARDAVTMARLYGMKIMLGCMIEPSISIAAAAHLGPLMDYVDLDGNVLLANDPYDGHPIEDGQIQLRDLPGLGVEPIEKTGISQNL